MSSHTNTDRFGCRASLSDFAHYSASPSVYRRKPRISDSPKLQASEIERSTGLERLLQSRAIEAAIWGMPLVRFDAMRQAFFRDAHAAYGDICYWSKPADWKLQFVTPSTLSSYVCFNFNTRMGPVVLELPPAPEVCLAGAIVSAWESTLVEVGHEGFDKGRGGKYLVLPPDYSGMVPNRYISVRADTYNARALFCVKPAVPGDTTSVMNIVKRMRVYSVMQAVNPPEQRFIDMSGRLFDGAVRFDDTLFNSLARMVTEEPMRTRDLVAMSQIYSIGIQKDRIFRPDRARREILNQSAEEVRAGLMKAAVEGEPLSSSTQWIRSDATCSGPAFTYETAKRFGIDARNVDFFMAFEPPKKRRRPSPCLRAFCDAAGKPLQGGENYRFHIPAGFPVQHWEVAAYDLETSSFVRESSRVAVPSHGSTASRNADGSADIYFGPRPEAGNEANCIYTAPGRPWFTLFRSYEPETVSGSAVLPDLEKIS